MGIIKDAKAQTLATHAQSAWDSGSAFFTPMIPFPSMRGGSMGRVEDWELMLSAVVAVGWRLHTWAVLPDKAVPLFVRP